MSNKIKNILLFIVLPITIVVSFWGITQLQAETTTKEYSQIVELFEQNKVKKFSLNLGSGELKYTLRKDKEEKIYTYDVNTSIFFEDINDIVIQINKKAKTEEEKIVYDYVR